MTLDGNHILITGAAARIGREIALHLASQGANIALHYHHSEEKAHQTQTEIHAMDVECHLFQADLEDWTSTPRLVEQANQIRPLDALINNASIFGSQGLSGTTPEIWQRHLDVNLSAPFALSQSLIASAQQAQRTVSIINLLDWRALRPGKDHFAYTISKAALASLTQALAYAAAPTVRINGIALGAILPPTDGGQVDGLLDSVPLKRWGDPTQVSEVVEFLLTGPDYITGEIIQLDGGRHLV